ncbi:MAG: glycosyltransferase [Actinomycetota bacterium]|nr:glycosyltransferase [Actinomycetota bacterium]
MDDQEIDDVVKPRLRDRARSVTDHGQGDSWRVAELDLRIGVEDLPTFGADCLLVTVFSGESPLGRILIPAPFDPMPRRLLEPHLEGFALRARSAELHEAFRDPSSPVMSATVVICTKDRLHHLRLCLKALGASDVPLELLVIDNGAGDPKVRQASEEAGATYVHEPVPGLDRARNRGLSAATGSIVLFTDDDVEVAQAWARHLLAPFVDPNTVAVTGLVLPASVSSPSAAAFERHATFVRGWESRLFDGTREAALNAGNAGAGASLAFRSDYLTSIGGFAEELDAGRPTGSGGDTYALYKALRDGWRVRYEPRAIAYHRHRESTDALAEAVRGYGRGVTAYMAKAALDDGDRRAPFAIVRWGLGRAVRAMARAALGRPGSELRLARQEAAGMLEGVPALGRSRRLLRDHPPLLAPGSTWEPEPPTSDVSSFAVSRRSGEVAVVIPSHGRRDSVLALVGAVLEQNYPADQLEIIVALDGDVDGSARALVSRFGDRVRVVAGERGGAGLARNRGAALSQSQILIFLDDDVTPVHKYLVAAHWAAHADGGVDVAIGGLHTRVAASDLSSRMVRNWWNDHSRRLGTLDSPTFSDVCTGNLSINSATFRRMGGFKGLPRREDWELGYRLLVAGAKIGIAAGADVVHHTDTSLAKGLRDRRLEGRGDAAIVRRSPEAYALLPLGIWHVLTSGRRRAASAAIARPQASERWAQKLTIILGSLEAAGLTDRAAAVVSLAFQTAYWSGVGEESGGEAGWLALAAEGRRRTICAVTSPLELTEAGRFRPPPPPVGEVLVTYRGQAIGAAPLRWGGIPWDRQRFAGKVIQRMAPWTLVVDAQQRGMP